MECGLDRRGFCRLNAMEPFAHDRRSSGELVVRNSRVSEKTLRFWVSRFNECGIDGMIHTDPAQDALGS